MYWKSDPNGSGYRIRQFDRPTVNPRSVRNVALRELTGEKDPNLSKKERQKKSFLMLLPPWLKKRTKRDLEQMESNMEK